MKTFLMCLGLVVGVAGRVHAAAAVNWTNTVPNLLVLTNLYSASGQALTNVGFTMTGPGLLGRSSGSGAVEVLNLPTDPVTIVQLGTNVIVDLSTYSLQLLTATNDLYITVTNASAGANVLLEINSGSTNRNVSFNSDFVWFCPKPTTIASNHLLWVSITPIGAASTNVRMSAVQSYP